MRYNKIVNVKIIACNCMHIIIWDRRGPVRAVRVDVVVFSCPCPGVQGPGCGKVARDDPEPNWPTPFRTLQNQTNIPEIAIVKNIWEWIIHVYERAWKNGSKPVSIWDKIQQKMRVLFYWTFFLKLLWIFNAKFFSVKLMTFMKFEIYNFIDIRN